MNDQQQPVKEDYVRAVCPTCGQQRELLDMKIWGYKGRYAEHVYSCDQCQTVTTYGSELTLFGDWIRSKSIKHIGGHENA
jgi:predicted RNA-binding Zn-ribbon protein involved in translation (DUF1610 family)